MLIKPYCEIWNFSIMPQSAVSLTRYSREPQSRLRRSGAGTGGWSAEELEAGLIEYLMGDYLRFISSLR